MKLFQRLSLISAITVAATSAVNSQTTDPPFLKYVNAPWVDSVIKTLTPEQRIAQLLWIPVYTNEGVEYDNNACELLKRSGAGGVVFFQGTAEKEADMTNYFRKICKVPPIIAIDGEWGIGMRLSGVTKFPYQMTLGAITDDSLIYMMGAEVASQMKRAGVNINLAPVSDVNNNPANPVINFRSFGEIPVNVSRKALMYMSAMQDNGIFSVAKHFPGHGDTNTDSHLDLPTIVNSTAHLDSVELVPFKTLINKGISGVMPGHLYIPSLDTAKGVPATFSYPILTGLLRNKLAFRGLMISDAMNMGGITKYANPGEVELKSLKAGMDVLEYVSDPELAVKSIMMGIRKGLISQSMIDEKCRRVLAAKYWAGLSKPAEVKGENITSDLTPVTMKVLVNKLYSNALTVVNNDNNIIPVKHLDSIRIATLVINKTGRSVFQDRLACYTRTDNFSADSLTGKGADNLLNRLKGYDLVIAGIFGTDQRPNKNFGIPEGLNEFLEKLVTGKKCIVTYFGNPYALDKLKALEKPAGLVVAYQENEFTEDLSAQLIFGAIGAKGRLPVSVNSRYMAGSGILTEGGIRVGYGIPESVGVNSAILQRKVDSLANLGISVKAYPGCEIMIARKGTVIFNKTYGWQTYENRTPVAAGDLYDLASVSKISGPLPGLMILNGEGKFSPEKTLGYYLPEYRKSNKADLVLKDMMAHQAGLRDWIPFWKETVKKDGRFKHGIFSHEYSEKYSLKVANDLYMNKGYTREIFREIRKSKLSGEKKYVYSDLTFIIIPKIITNLTGENWYDFVTSRVYHKIGAYDIGFNPYLKYPMERIVPTEYDSLFRKQLLHGTVHDEGAAMQGGISGHAGLFATANDLMKLMETYRRMGSYGGEQIISSDIMKEYTRYQFPENNNRRGLGFDKPLVNNRELKQEDTYPTLGTPPESFGHSGYTGTFVWMDPVNEITYVFFCNRVYPTRNNSRLTDLNIRTEILQSIYDSLGK
ncbi:MAG TPA: glycoside hydrolase family 3 N-terminal domain-containing protein [Bacteroidales bacterium]|nr:glycoside hydrolase family 3 N-terminal domain-containing protein [Bacteroidales bacterium]